MSDFERALNFTLMPTISNLQKQKLDAESEVIAKDLLENKNMEKDLNIIAKEYQETKAKEASVA